jgi:hypothetical protein
VASRRKKKQKQKKRVRPPGPGRTLQGLLGGAQVVVPAAGETKMSEVIWDFLAPYVEDWRRTGDLEKLVLIGTAAWNAALLPGGEREKFLQEMAQAVDPEVREYLRATVLEMIRRKEQHFAACKRAILGHELAMTPTGPYLQVVSSLDAG